VRLAGLICALGVAGCATGAPAPAGGPSFQLSPGEAPPAIGQLIAACVGKAQTLNGVDRQAGENWLRFTCHGPEAQALYDALGPWAAAHGSEYVAEARTWRFTQTISRNPDGRDFCWRVTSDPRGPVHGCTIVLNVGEVLDAR
jgi:hypothetical protein